MPSTITVSNTNNDGPGSLRAAIELANSDAAADTIDFATGVTGSISLLSALPNLATNIVLDGPGASVVTVARNSNLATPDFRIFNVTPGAEVTIAGLTISGGRLIAESGGGIANAGTLTVTRAILSGNSADGGGIANRGVLTIIDSTIRDNWFSGERGGGGIFSSGTLTITNSTISGNSAGSDEADFRASGGGIYNSSGTLTITGSTIRGNSASGAGGGIFNSGTLTVIDSTVSDNTTGIFGNGGGIANTGTLTVANSTIRDNAARIHSGGGFVNFGTLTVITSTLSGNSAFSGGGGGIQNLDGTLTVITSTLSGNSAFSGGGIENIRGAVTVSGSTFSGNSARSLLSTSGGGIANSDTLTITTSIFANSTGGNLSQGSSALFFSRGHNLFSDVPGVSLDPTDLVDTDPLLGPLGDYGGPTQTIPLLPGSPAINAGSGTSGVSIDQRGVPRTQGNAPDIGAFESNGFSLILVSGNNQSTPQGSAFPSPLVVRVVSFVGEPVAGGRVQFSSPTTGPAASFNANPATIDAAGLASVIATANGLVGPFVATARTAGAGATLAFALENRVSPPMVVGLKRFGVHAQPTTLVLRFSAPLDAARAQDVANYRIVTLGGHGRGSAQIGHVTRVRRAVYDPATGSVTLHPTRRLDLHNIYRLTVRGTAPAGLTSATGVLLDGAGTGQPGSDFVATIDRRTLAGSSRAFLNQIRHRWASRTGKNGFGAIDLPLAGSSIVHQQASAHKNSDWSD